MAVYTTKLFDKKLRSEILSDGYLCEIAHEVMNGRFEGDLGGGVIKKRIALNAGKSVGARTIIFFKLGSNLFFADGWKKNQVRKGVKEIQDDELAVYKDIAGDLLQLTVQQIAQLVKVKELREVECDGCKDERAAGNGKKPA
ncbi:type II toxin-antitoxin system RelE/ParE family toxin [Pectobacterium carotovorum]|uniref:type II toxin-antitoxin system RelE/ParE family toxin n=1 Tax=Pectobacterium odoriferum TaxID=78398 RepID=UPI0013739ACE|nr:type II toxin-antitoxin system RelE/ParE family toxin [Pectobacterium odoriferum]QHP78585.1 type II toxin-antitoxin system RelE/ParE family toxin [Pectobacterium odoriferum]